MPLGGGILAAGASGGGVAPEALATVAVDAVRAIEVDFLGGVRLSILVLLVGHGSVSCVGWWLVKSWFARRLAAPVAVAGRADAA